MRSQIVHGWGLLLACLALGSCSALPPGTGGGSDAAVPASQEAEQDPFPVQRDAWASRVLALAPLYELRAESESDPERKVVFTRLAVLSRTLAAGGGAASSRAALQGVRSGERGVKTAALKYRDTLDDSLQELVMAMLRSEDAIYRETLLERARQDYDFGLQRRLTLLERKYFHDPEDDGGNFLEGLMNSSFPLTQTYQVGDQGWQESPRVQGVSPWEAVARIEPVYSFSDETELGAVASIGLTRHFFPQFEDGSATVQETPLSEWVKRAGVRIGAGILDHPGENPDFATGAAIQLGSFSVWGLYNFEEEDFSVAIGAADFEFVKDLLPVF